MSTCRAAAGCALLALAGAAVPLDPTLALIQQRITQQNIVQPQDIAQWDALTAFNLALLSPTSCNFTDIDYTYQQPAIWPAYNHTMRTLWFAQAWASPGSAYYNDSAFLATTLCALDFWLVHGSTFFPSNWWWSVIGNPLSVGPTVNMLAAFLLPNQTAAAVTQLALANPAHYDGANLVWTSEGTIYRGVLSGNMTAVQWALGLSYNTLVYSPGTDGPQVDASFFQHGPQLYSGGYGMSWALGIALMLSLTNGTPLALPSDDPRMALFSHIMLDGSLQMMRYGPQGPPAGSIYGTALWDTSVIGRDISRPYGSNWGNQAGVQVEFTPAMIAGVGGPRADEFVAFATLLNGSATPAQAAELTAGSRVFSAADYVLHTASPATAAATAASGRGLRGVRAPVTSGPGATGVTGWMLSVRMASKRTLRCEAINGENKMGLHLSDGASYLSTGGYEYVDTYPVWDWQRLPGTAVLPYAVPQQYGGYGTTAFVGGVAQQAALLGSAVNDYVAAWGEGLTGRKSTFLFPDLYVALGANFTAAANVTTFPMWVGVAQRRLSDTGVFTSGSPSTPLPPGTNTSLPAATAWVWEGSIGYIMMSPSPVVVHVSNVVENGTWEAIGAMTGNVSVPMFTLWLEHPAPVAAATYAYAVVPDISLADFIARVATLSGAPAAGGLAVVRNDAGVQAVLHGGAQALQATVFELDAATGAATIDGGAGWNATLSAPGAYIVALATGGGQLAFSAAQPTQSGPWSVQLNIDRNVVAGAAGANATCIAGAGASGGVSLLSPPGNGTTQTAACALAA